MVPDATPRSYYGRPILKAPAWKPHVPVYFFAGGLAGASSVLAFGARLSGNHRLARAALLVSAAGLLPSPFLLVDDLGRPERFFNMLRVFKPTSPLNVGSWLLLAFGPASAAAAGSELLGVLPRAGRVAETVAAALGPFITTYTAVVVADTAVPAWRDARHELPFVFAGGAAASAGAAAVALTPVVDARPARRLVAVGAATSLVALDRMHRTRGVTMEPYRSGPAGRLSSWSRALTATGAAITTILGRRRRAAAVGGSALVLAGALCERFAVVRAGLQSVADPAYTIGPQRARTDEPAVERNR
jgi:formate-dependent nitrite reductase membrane component NrfD